MSLTAEFLDINAYDQPGVEAGKIEARAQLSTMKLIEAELSNTPATANDLAGRIGLETATVWRICQHLSGQGRARKLSSKSTADDTFCSI